MQEHALEDKRKLRSKDYYRRHKELILEKCRQYRNKNREFLAEKSKIYRKNNKEAISESRKKFSQKNAERIANIKKTFYEQNKEKMIRQQIEYQKNRIKTDSKYSIYKMVSSRISKAIRRRGWPKCGPTQAAIGCDFNTLETHLILSAIRNYGEWFSYQKYHIDHIVPLVTAQTIEDLYRLNHFTNLQYLYPEDNLRKSDKLDFKLEREV
jgi:hypothetical protein